MRQLPSSFTEKLLQYSTPVVLIRILGEQEIKSRLSSKTITVEESETTYQYQDKLTLLDKLAFEIPVGGGLPPVQTFRFKTTENIDVGDVVEIYLTFADFGTVSLDSDCLLLLKGFVKSARRDFEGVSKVVVYGERPEIFKKSLGVYIEDRCENWDPGRKGIIPILYGHYILEALRQGKRRFTWGKEGENYHCFNGLWYPKIFIFAKDKGCWVRTEGMPCLDQTAYNFYEDTLERRYRINPSSAEVTFQSDTATINSLDQSIDKNRDSYTEIILEQQGDAVTIDYHFDDAPGFEYNGYAYPIWYIEITTESSYQTPPTVKIFINDTELYEMNIYGSQSGYFILEPVRDSNGDPHGISIDKDSLKSAILEVTFINNEDTEFNIKIYNIGLYYTQPKSKEISDFWVYKYGRYTCTPDCGNLDLSCVIKQFPVVLKDILTRDLYLSVDESTFNSDGHPDLCRGIFLGKAQEEIDKFLKEFVVSLVKYGDKYRMVLLGDQPTPIKEVLENDLISGYSIDQKLYEFNKIVLNYDCWMGECFKQIVRDVEGSTTDNILEITSNWIEDTDVANDVLDRLIHEKSQRDILYLSTNLKYLDLEVGDVIIFQGQNYRIYKEILDLENFSIKLIAYQN